MAKKSAAKKKTVEEVVEEVKDEGIEVEVVVEEPKEKAPTRMLVAAGGKEWYVDADGNKIEE